MSKTEHNIENLQIQTSNSTSTPQPPPPVVHHHFSSIDGFGKKQFQKLHLEPTPSLPPHYHTTKNVPSHLNLTLLKAFQTAKSNFSDLINDIPKKDLEDTTQPVCGITITWFINTIEITTITLVNLIYEAVYAVKGKTCLREATETGGRTLERPVVAISHSHTYGRHYKQISAQVTDQFSNSSVENSFGCLDWEFKYNRMNTIITQTILVCVIGIIMLWLSQRGRVRNVRRRRYTVLDKIPAQMRNMHDLVMVSDDDCKDQLRMDRASFHKLCGLVRTFDGLKSSRNISVEEKRSGQTVSKHFNQVLNCVLSLQGMFLVPALSVDANTSDPWWAKFQGCLGALDGTYIDVHEGSAADSRVLRDAIHRTNGLHVPRGHYYLCDNGYPNCEGFLTPYKGVRYHLSEWLSRQPETYQEYFNMKHTRARNVIERTFGLLKMRWAILRSPSWYPIKTTNKIIVACCLLHNYIRREMDVDPLEGGLDDYMNTQMDAEPVVDVDVIENLESSTEWNTWRDTMAQNMFNEWNLTF
ncbi:hypothetical protein ACS0TY_030257 [Phlomoides rotata]